MFPHITLSLIQRNILIFHSCDYVSCPSLSRPLCSFVSNFHHATSYFPHHHPFTFMFSNKFSIFFFISAATATSSSSYLLMLFFILSYLFICILCFVPKIAHSPCPAETFLSDVVSILLTSNSYAFRNIHTCMHINERYK